MIHCALSCLALNTLAGHRLSGQYLQSEWLPLNARSHCILLVTGELSPPWEQGRQHWASWHHQSGVAIFREGPSDGSNGYDEGGAYMLTASLRSTPQHAYQVRRFACQFLWCGGWLEALRHRSIQIPCICILEMLCTAQLDIQGEKFCHIVVRFKD